MTDGMEVAVVEPQSASSLTIFGTDDPSAIVTRVSAIATPLAEFIERKKMSTVIGGNKYVLQEGWSFMGAMLGVAPRTVSVTELRDDAGRVCGFEAKVELLMRDGAVVGGAIAECSRYESNWQDRDDFALKSMSQTRATGKAYRMAFGFVMKAAGYEATPAEEMPIDERREPMQSRAIEPPRPRGRDVSDDGEFRNVGQLLTWALRKHGLDRAQVFEVLHVAVAGDIGDLGEARRTIEERIGAPAPV